MVESSVCWSPLIRTMEAVVSSASPLTAIVAPFVQSDALIHVLERVPITKNLRVVTRWNPSDLKTGVSDPEAYTVLKKLNLQLFHSPDIHSKIYLQTNGRALIGSGNLTNAGLGITSPSRIQYETGAHVQLREIDLAMIDFLFDRSELINEERYLLAKKNAGSESGTGPDKPLSRNLYLEDLPTSESPEMLWEIYCRTTSAGTIEDRDKAGWLDILHLRIPLNITDHETFSEQLKACFLCSPLVNRVVSYIATFTPVGKAAYNANHLGVQNGAIRQFVSSLVVGDRHSVAQRVNNLQTWLPWCKPEIHVEISVPGRGNSHVFTWTDPK